MLYELKDYKLQLRNIVNSLLKILEKYTESEFLKNIEDEAEKQLQKYTPSIMFYGVYNSGKSSIINALVGEEIAKVGDIPTTSSIQSIAWNGFTLVDTPGIVANDEHTEIAEQEIKRNNVILFVVDDIGTFENIEVSTAILKIINSGKPIIVVVNQKEASTEGAYSTKIRKTVIPKIIDNLKRAAQSQGYVGDPLKAKNFCEVVSVNAFSAFKAKTQYNKDSEEYHLFMKSSGIEGLVSVLQQQLNKSEGINLLKPCVSIIKSYIEQGIDIIESELIKEVDQLYVKAIKEIEKKKNDLYKNILYIGRNEINSYGDKIYSQVMQGNDVNELALQLKARLAELIREKFANTNLQLENTFNIYQVQFDEHPQLNIADLRNITLQLQEEVSEDNIRMDDIFMKNQIHLKNNFSMKSVNWGTIIITVIKLILDKKRKEEEQKLLQEKVDEYNAKIQQTINEKVAAIYEVNNKIRAELMKLENSFIETIDHLVESSFTKATEEMQNMFDIKKQENNKLEQDISVLRNLIHEIDSFEVMFD